MFVLIIEYRFFNVISVCVLVDLVDKEFSLLFIEYVCVKEKMLNKYICILVILCVLYSKYM